MKYNLKGFVARYFKGKKYFSLRQHITYALLNY